MTITDHDIDVGAGPGAGRDTDAGLALHALESAAFAAWPALEEERLAGWRLRFAGGYTKRANSANAGADATRLSEADIAEIERRYRGRGLPVIFRMVSFSGLDAVDDALAVRGYERVDPSLVMTAPLAPEAGAGEGASAEPVTLDVADWLEAFQSVSGKLGPGQATHLAMLRAIEARTAFAVDAAGDPACCALGVASGSSVGLFDVATRPEARGRGAATRLCAQLMDWGRRQGASTAYLQVMARNEVARRLYERLGFRVAYDYWYRVLA